MAQQLVANGATPEGASMALMKCYPEAGFSLDMQVKSSPTYLWLYFALTFGILVFNYLGFQSLNALCLFVSSKLHNKMLKSLIGAKMAFFDTTEFGRITSRISKDVESLDSRVSQFGVSTTQSAFQLIAMVVSTAALSWPCALIMLPCAAIFLCVLSSFRRIYPQVRRLEAAARSPVLGLASETLECLSAARSARETLSAEFRSAADAAGSLTYL